MEPVIPLSIMLSLMGGAASALLTLGKRFESLEQSQASKIEMIDRRIDSIELRLAKEYVGKEDLANILEKLDNRIDRMDYKLDQILIGYNKTASLNKLNGPF